MHCTSLFAFVGYIRKHTYSDYPYPNKYYNPMTSYLFLDRYPIHFTMQYVKTTSYKAWPCSWLFLGGDKRDRTADLLNAIQALSQLSYTPIMPEPVEIPRVPGVFTFDGVFPSEGSFTDEPGSQLSYTPNSI